VGSWAVATTTSGLVSIANKLRQVLGIRKTLELTGFPSPQPLDPTFSNSQIKIGDFLSYPFSVMSENLGFGFSPAKNFEQTLFMNSAALVGAPSGQMFLTTNFSDQLQSSLLFPLSEQFAIALGYLMLRNQEERTISDSSIGPFFDTSRYETVEQAFFVGAAIKVSHQISVGITGKYISQSTEIPWISRETFPSTASDSVSIVETVAFQKKMNSSNLDFDLSAYYSLTHNFNLGISLMNIAGTRLLDEGNYGFSDDGGQMQTDFRTVIRTLGMGLSYNNSKISLGNEVQIDKDGNLSMAMGLNYVPFSDSSIRIGFSSEYDTRSFAANFKHLGYTFNTNNLLGRSHSVSIIVRF